MKVPVGGRSVVRIALAEHGSFSGTGYLIGQCLITCAHCLSQRGDELRPGATVWFSFPGDRPRPATLARIGRASDPSADWAVCVTVDSKIEREFCLFGDCYTGHPYNCFGYKNNWLEFGNSAQGVFGELNGQGLLELIGDWRGFQIGPGFSGAPVFELISNRVAGHVVGDASDSLDARVAFMLPIQRFISVIPALDAALAVAPFDDTELRRIVQLAADPAIGALAARYLAGVRLRQSEDDPSSRHFIYLTLGYLGGHFARAAISTALAVEQDRYARRGAEDARRIMQF